MRPERICFSLSTALLACTLTSTNVVGQQARVNPQKRVSQQAKMTPQTLRWYGNIRKAWREAKQSDRHLLVFVSTAGCGHCTNMITKTLKEPTVEDEIRSTFVPSAIKRADHSALVERLRIDKFPTTLLFNPEGELVGRLTGFVPPQQMRQRLSRVDQQLTRR